MEKVKTAKFLGGLLLSCALLAGCGSAGAVDVAENGREDGSAASEETPQAGGETMETVESVFYFNGGVGEDSLPAGLRIPSSFGDESRRERTMQALQEWGVYRQTPDCAVSREGRPLLELYSEEDKRVTGIVFHRWTQSSANAEDGEPAERMEEETYCALLPWDALEKLGTLAYSCDSDQRTLEESFSDPEGTLQAYVAYEYAPDVPFPMISECRYTSAEDGNQAGFPSDLRNILNRPQRFLLYKEKMNFSGEGRWQGYDGCLHAGSRAVCLYDEAGRLQTIREETGEPLSDGGDSLSGEIAFAYRDDGLDTVSYWFNPGSGSTADSSGTIAYDGQGRPQYKEYYVTHGTHYGVYLYKGSETRPWLCLEFCSQVMGPEDEDGVSAGCVFHAYLFHNPQESVG